MLSNLQVDAPQTLFLSTAFKMGGNGQPTPGNPFIHDLPRFVSPPIADPINCSVMTDPVKLPTSGQVVERCPTPPPESASRIPPPRIGFQLDFDGAYGCLFWSLERRLPCAEVPRSSNRIPPFLPHPSRIREHSATRDVAYRVTPKSPSAGKDCSTWFLSLGPVSPRPGPFIEFDEATPEHK